MNRRTTARLLAVPTALVLSLTACGDDGAGDEPTSQSCETRAETADAPDDVSTDLAEKPEVPTTDASPPCGLQISDVVVGDGPEAVQGASVAVKYVGAFYGTGEEFDSSWSRGENETLPVTVGAGQVITGFDQAIDGMQVGGRRMVTIPSDLGYGPTGQGPIPGDATLVFVLDLVEVA
ncbi:FKBP-type peptidyl-prolyl cis-trans isomerase [Blastococcus haudaquaticus]|uniref:Peptidyl-prolyl cis-trans isomerase n=1 Tax=Blastococcus haudaquaticus TaxID=1938745 RepID=A0A286H6F4_9ACTN|nr:FKBP-type peptidyl-prolyl cis-trans isomerase [Blastococcus haudaquaticus]SOE03056.1 FKBP-type peptidyl-prolyl cis-trans isomerase [Blastococcus haudaquaticus]